MADGTQAHNWRAIWLFAGGLSAVILVLFVVAFREREAGETAS
jgi:hypothetical protein